MPKKKNGPFPLPTETSPMEDSTDSMILSRDDNVPQNLGLVKWDGSRAEQLQWLLSHTQAGKEIMATVQQSSPKFDKSCMAKAKRSNLYGVEIRGDILKKLWLTYAPEEYAKRKRHTDGHKLTKRLSCRLEDDVYEAFVQKCEADGYKDSNDCLKYLVSEYLKGE